MVDGDTFAAPVITRDTVAVETDAFLATSRIPMALSTPVGSTFLKIRSYRQFLLKFADHPKTIGHVQPAVEYLNLQSITFPVF